MELVDTVVRRRDDGGYGYGGETAAAERGPITFAMGANDTGKLVPIIEAWNAEHPDEEVTLSELPQEADQQRETLVQSLQANSGDYDVMALDVTWTDADCTRRHHPVTRSPAGTWTHPFWARLREPSYAVSQQVAADPEEPRRA